MQYFREFPQVQYRFGNETSTEVFRNITAYADVIDQIKDDISFYNNITIDEGTRPDQLSVLMYGTPAYHWTFYLLNDNLRIQGWPLSNVELEAKAKKDYPDTVITTTADLKGVFKVGRTVVGSTSNATGKIIHRNLELGQLVIQGSHTFNNNEQVTSTYNVPGGLEIETITLTAASAEHLAANHYVDGDSKRVDIDPQNGPGALLTEVTNFDNMINENEALRTIRVIRPQFISQIASSFKGAVRGS